MIWWCLLFVVACVQAQVVSFDSLTSGSGTWSTSAAPSQIVYSLPSTSLYAFSCSAASSTPAFSGHSWQASFSFQVEDLLILRLSLRLAGVSTVTFTPEMQSLFVDVLQTALDCFRVDIVAVRESVFARRLVSTVASVDVMVDAAVERGALNSTLDSLQGSVINDVLLASGMPFTVVVLEYGVFTVPPPPTWTTPPVVETDDHRDDDHRDDDTDDDHRDDVHLLPSVEKTKAGASVLAPVLGGVLGGMVLVIAVWWRRVHDRVTPLKLDAINL